MITSGLHYRNHGSLSVEAITITSAVVQGGKGASYALNMFKRFISLHNRTSHSKCGCVNILLLIIPKYDMKNAQRGKCAVKK